MESSKFNSNIVPLILYIIWLNSSPVFQKSICTSNLSTFLINTDKNKAYYLNKSIKTLQHFFFFSLASCKKLTKFGNFRAPSQNEEHLRLCVDMFRASFEYASGMVGFAGSGLRIRIPIAGANCGCGCG